jgi:hypothetical protein
VDQEDALYVPERIAGSFWIKVRDFERSFYTGTVVDAVRFVRRDLFLQVGGFDETLVAPGDWDFNKKIRKIGQTGIANMYLYHYEGCRLNMRQYLKKKGYYADGTQGYVRKWGHTDLETIKQVSARYQLGWKQMLVKTTSKWCD